MPASQNPAAYADAERVFAEALHSENGLKLEFGTEPIDQTKARNFRHRLNTYRSILRKDSKRVYQPDDPKYGICQYDKFVMRVTNEAGNWCLRIEAEPSLDAKIVKL